MLLREPKQSKGILVAKDKEKSPAEMRSSNRTFHAEVSADRKIVDLACFTTKKKPKYGANFLGLTEDNLTELIEFAREIRVKMRLDAEDKAKDDKDKK